ncbi:SICA antigen [Plasmodium coatneyi]|uniref:SICA antigen n=1 Tax=Plasmodium coatneyi TaxID=208452 RepID=A0A1B1DV64_9APIC|nr:SICA antigen [Plasmodium coatneyi]ANQ06624.1 SICA antigen [Plasmodium coatneyi]
MNILLRSNAESGVILTVDGDRLLPRTPSAPTGGATTCNTDLHTRLKTVTEKWFQLRGKKKTQEQDLTAFWKDVENVLGKLAKALTATEEPNNNLCNNSAGKQSRTLTESEKTACKNIAKGLKGIYGIQLTKSDKQQHPVENQKFEQTIGCLMLNLYAQEIKKKCPIMGETVQQAFPIHEKLHKTACADKVNNCVQCEWDECANYTLKEGVDLRTKLKAMLLENKDIKKTMSTISDSSAIGGWFTLFSNDVSRDDKKNYEELDPLLSLCGGLKEDLGDVMEKYEGFCEVMIRNIILTTGVPKQYKNEKGKTSCEKIVREILNKNQKYVECAYEDALNIPYGGGTDVLDEAYHLFGTSTLYHKIEALTNKKAWCLEAPTRPKLARDDLGVGDRIINGNDHLKELKEVVENVTEVLKEEEGGEGGVSETSEAKESGKEKPEEEKPSASDVTDKKEDPGKVTISSKVATPTRSECGSGQAASPEKAFSCAEMLAGESTQIGTSTNNPSGNWNKDTGIMPYGGGAAECLVVHPVLVFINTSFTFITLGADVKEEKTSEEPGSPGEDTVTKVEPSEQEQAENADGGVTEQVQPVTPAPAPSPGHASAGGGGGRAGAIIYFGSTLACFVRQENVTEELIKYVAQPYKNNSLTILSRMVHMNIP